jgi:hypothetical protein
LLIDFCLIFVPFGHYDEPEILRYAITSICPKGADVRQAVYLHELTDGFVAQRVIGDWIDFYNTGRPHSALAGQTPAEAYRAERPVDMMDKASALPTSPQTQQQQNVINRILAA